MAENYSLDALDEDPFLVLLDLKIPPGLLSRSFGSALRRVAYYLVF